MATFPTGRMRRIFRLSALFALMIGIGIVAPIVLHALKERSAIAVSQIRPHLATDLEQEEIVRAILASRSGLLVPPGNSGQPLVVLQTVAICDPRGTRIRSAQCDALPGVGSISNTDLDPEIPRSLRLELIAANSRPAPLASSTWRQVPLSQFDSVAEAMREMVSWDRFYTTFPDSIGLVEFSRAVKSKDGNHALIYVGHYAGRLAGRGSLQYLTRQDKKWVIHSLVRLWAA